MQALEKVCQELIERAKTKDLRAKGPVRLPTKTLKIMVRCKHSPKRRAKRTRLT